MAPNAFDHFAVQNVIAKYCLLLDTKNFGRLREVFTEDVDAVYPFKGEIKGVKEVAGAIEKRLAPVTSQHAITTQSLNFETDDKVNAITYFTSIHFGHQKWEGRQVTAWGMCQDEIVRVEGEVEAAGASGRWRIRKREIIFHGRLGEEGVMDGEPLPRHRKQTSLTD